MNAAFPKEWLDALVLSERSSPDLYLSWDEVIGHRYAAAMRLGFEELGLAGYFCVQDVPTIAFLVQERLDLDQIDLVHEKLWNQSIVSLLFVISGEELRAYSLACRPTRHGPESDRRLIDTFHLVAKATELRDLVTGVESGRLIEIAERAGAFDPKERVDRVLLDNLMETHSRLLRKGLDDEAAQALLMQSMFIAYLEDRDIIGADDFVSATTQQNITSFRTLVQAADPQLLGALFSALNDDFNGDLFQAPCAFTNTDSAPEVTSAQLEIIAEFLWGDWELASRQRRFWAYRFRYIPVELISAVYNRFLSLNPERKEKEGSYYTPLVLVELVVDQIWSLAQGEIDETARVLDPACGSGIFLVRYLDRLAESVRAKRQFSRLSWSEVNALVERMHGWDTNSAAVRIAIFSIYIALLDQFDPREIRELMAQGKRLPRLYGRTLCCQDFFSVDPEANRFDLVIGNPPWASRGKKIESAVAWCDQRRLPIPGGEAAWGFAWKIPLHLAPFGRAALLLPAMGFLLNHARESVQARRRWFAEVSVDRVINFADLRFLLFEGAKRPTALAIFRPGNPEKSEHHLDYWCPKADYNVRTRRLLLLSRADQGRLSLYQVMTDDLVFKRRMWLRGPDAKLLQYLETLPRLSGLVTQYKEIQHRHREIQPKEWVIGQGFQPVDEGQLENAENKTATCPEVTQYPFLDIKSFRPWVLPNITADPRRSSRVRRLGFVKGFVGPHILIPQGIGSENRIRATYTEQNLAFFHTLQSIIFPAEERPRAKILTAVLNSRLTAWFFFHQSASFGADRPKVHQEQLLMLPFPAPHDLPNPAAAWLKANEIVATMDDLLARADRLLDADHWNSTKQQLDQLVYDYYDLTEDEVAVVEDTFDYVIPAMQPRLNKPPPELWHPSNPADWNRYCRALERALKEWLRDGTEVSACIAAHSPDLAVACVQLGNRRSLLIAQDETALQDLLPRLWSALPASVSRNVEIIPDLRVFIGDDLYLVKPRKKRFWLYSAALDDADGIAAELFSTAEARRRQG